MQYLTFILRFNIIKKNDRKCNLSAYSCTSSIYLSIEAVEDNPSEQHTDLCVCSRQKENSFFSGFT